MTLFWIILLSFHVPTNINHRSKAMNAPRRTNLHQPGSHELKWLGKFLPCVENPLFVDEVCCHVGLSSEQHVPYSMARNRDGCRRSYHPHTGELLFVWLFLFLFYNNFYKYIYIYILVILHYHYYCNFFTILFLLFDDDDV